MDKKRNELIKARPVQSGERARARCFSLVEARTDSSLVLSLNRNVYPSGFTRILSTRRGAMPFAYAAAPGNKRRL